jgi:hypothetical protein
MERALFLRPGEPLEPGPGWDRLYYGSESCPWMLPSPEELAGALEKAGSLGLPLTLVTPYLFDELMDDAERLLEALPGGGEVVVNDYGLLRAVVESGNRLVPILGRLLVKRTVAPGSGEDSAGSLPGYLAATGLDSPLFVDFLRREGFGRVEIDHLPGDSLSTGETLPASYHHPLELITLTSRCPWRFDGRRWTRGPCSRPCLEGDIALNSPGGRLDNLLSGCAQYIRREELPDLGGTAVDRLVIHRRPGEGDHG